MCAIIFFNASSDTVFGMHSMSPLECDVITISYGRRKRDKFARSKILFMRLISYIASSSYRRSSLLFMMKVRTSCVANTLKALRARISFEI